MPSNLRINGTKARTGADVSRPLPAASRDCGSASAEARNRKTLSEHATAAWETVADTSLSEAAGEDALRPEGEIGQALSGERNEVRAEREPAA